MKRTAVTALILLVATGCSLERRLDVVTERLETDYATLRSWAQLPERTISWQQAIAMMQKNNADLKNAEMAAEQAQRETLSVYTDMIPGLSYYGYFTKSIEALSALSTSDLSSQVNMTFSIPTITQVPYRVYAAEARAFAALKAREGKLRELKSKLYKLVRTREINRRLKEHETTSPDAAENSAPKSPLAEVDAEGQYLQDVATLLGNYEARWNILPETMPRVRWEDYRAKLGKPDSLIMCNFAMELEKARLSQYGIALRYLPTVNTNLYSPSLFSSTGGTYEGTFLSSEDTKLNLSISYDLDTRLDNWYNYKDSKDRYEMAKRRVALAMLEHKNKVAKLTESVQEYKNWQRYMNKRLEYTRSSPSNTAAEFLAKERTIFDMKKEMLNQEKQLVESEAAIILEYGMPQ